MAHLWECKENDQLSDFLSELDEEDYKLACSLMNLAVITVIDEDTEHLKSFPGIEKILQKYKHS